MRRAIVGTAGHIDHGKTRLVEALTGIDCDRWAEEKERGITIDLGFAHLEQDDLQVGFVDVPGHERFLHNALAGLGGIRIMLLVVAADEGIEPQTREHLAICSLLGIPAGLVALTKTDLVSPDLVELARLEIEELLATTPFAGAEVLAVSSTTGAGIPELRARLVALAAEHPAEGDPALPARLPIDRAFHLRGLGVVATGTLAAGRVRPGDALEVLPGGERARVRSVQVHGGERAEALAGERTALQLTGVPLDRLTRGLQLVAPGGYGCEATLAGRLELLPEAPKPLAGSTAVRFHLLSTELHGRVRPLAGPIAPGGAGPVEIRLAGPVAAIRGDRFVLRRPSPPLTLGGGVVLDPAWRRRRGKALERALSALESDDGTLLLWAGEEGEAGLDARDPARRCGIPESEAVVRLEGLAALQKLLEAPAGQGHGRRWLPPAAYRRVVERARRVLADYFAADRLATGMPKAEAVERILPGRGAELADVYLGWLAAQEVLIQRGDRLDLPGRSSELSGGESKLAEGLLAAFRAFGLEPPSPPTLARQLGAKPQILDGVVRYLVDRGQLVRLPSGLILAASELQRVAAELAASDWERFSVGDFKERYGLSRKWAIPILEHLDSVGATLRLGNERLVVRREEP